ncbi:Cys-Gln thioester bond-forming surface protein [Embleya sp. NPDC005575]|uniref:Cys-Gln thioester bond-forming surface protein n=1 Tax=Embleya sp. NPDC005575 TaxID=3156892 RepID=UPI0033ADF80D
MFLSQRVISRVGSACAATGLAAVAIIGLSPAAYADSMTLRFQGHVPYTDGSVDLSGRGSFQTELIILGAERENSPQVLLYCIDLDTRLDTDASYREGTWAESWLKDTAKVAKINWVLNNSFPKVTDLDVLAKTANVSNKKGRLSAKEAVEATQAAIWHYSNGANLRKGKTWEGEDANDKDVVALYDYLTGDANKGQPNEPGASLELSPSTISGKDGDTPGVGPVTVKTTSTEPVAVKLDGTVPAGTSLVGKDGKPINTAANGTELYVKAPKTPGQTTISASTKAGVNIGRVFVGKNRKHTQTLITGGSQPFSALASATVKWSHQPVPIPSSAYKEDCVAGGVTITLKNTGDGPADFKVNGNKVTLPPNSTKTQSVKVAEDTDYTVTVTGPGGFSETYTGKLDCVENPQPPTTAPPTSEAPTTAPPTTSTPTTSTPSTSAPTTSAPSTSAPSTSAPATSAPATTSAPPSASASSRPSASASASAPAASASPTKGGEPVTPIVVPGKEDKPVVVPWLPVAPAGNGKDLAETGGDDSDTILIAGTAAALLAAGGGAIYLNRRRGRHQA